MATAGRTTLADISGRGWSVQAFNHHGAAIFAHSQDDRDTLAAQMTGWGGLFFRAFPEAPEELPQGLH